MNLYIHKTIKLHSCQMMRVHFFPLSDLSGWRHTKNNVCLHFGVVVVAEHQEDESEYAKA